MRHVASHAAPMALIFTSAGSQMKASYASMTPPVLTSTQKLTPLPSPSALVAGKGGDCCASPPPEVAAEGGDCERKG